MGSELPAIIPVSFVLQDLVFCWLTYYVKHIEQPLTFNVKSKMTVMISPNIVNSNS